MSKENGGPAFPFETKGSTATLDVYYGQTLRDYFAAAAIQGCDPGNLTVQGMRQMAEGAYALADAMLAERAK